MRTREHVIADLSANYLEKIVLKKGYTVEGYKSDYGYDLSLYTYYYPPGSTDGEYENEDVRIQLKATDNINIRHGGKYVCLPVERRHFELWNRSLMPVILVVYDARNEVAYWLHAQPYIRSLSTKTSDSRVFLLPTTNVVDADAVEQWRQLKIARCAEIERAEASLAKNSAP